MIRLINNEFIKVKKVKLFFSIILYLIALYIMFEVSDKSILDMSYNLIPFIGIFVSIFFCGTISSERENGSFRYYLTKPIKRWKIYLSKLICILLYITISILFIIIFTSILNKDINMIYYLKYFTYSIPIYFIGVFILYLSTIFKSQTFSASISILTLSFSLLVSQILFGIKLYFIEYTFLPYLDYSLFNDKMLVQSLNHDLSINLSLNKGIIIDFIYMLLLFLLGIKKFIKKDIKS